jgi:hypothetical protein
MATASPISDAAPDTPAAAAVAAAPATLLVSLAPLGNDALETMLHNLSTVFAGRPVLVVTPDGAPHGHSDNSSLQLISYTPTAPSPGTWVLTAADYVNTFKLMQENGAATCLLLGAEAQSLHPEAIRALADSASTADLTTPRYEIGPRDGLVNSAILYPITRALFGTRPRFPLAVDLALTRRMAERLAATSQKFTAANENAALIWPVAEAAAAGYSIAEVPAGPRTLPPPDVADLNTLLAQVAGSIFADVDAKAAFWQRSRLAYSAKSPASPIDHQPSAAPGELPDVQPMLDSFRLAFSNLQEIWSLVLPPNSLLGLKKLSLMPSTAFRMPDALWARIVYDFILAFRLRTINRGHLMGALTPLYLAWVASHLLLAGGSNGPAIAPEKHIEALAAAFEVDKPYLVSRWRWPDRFNP